MTPKCKCGHGKEEHNICDECGADIGSKTQGCLIFCPCMEYLPKRTGRKISCKQAIKIAGGILVKAERERNKGDRPKRRKADK